MYHLIKSQVIQRFYSSLLMYHTVFGCGKIGTGGVLKSVGGIFWKNCLKDVFTFRVFKIFFDESIKKGIFSHFK